MIPVDQIQELRSKARDLCAGLSHDAFVWRRAPGSWSVAECLDHLNATNRLYVDVIDGGVRQARSSGITGTGPFRLGFLERQFAKWLEPPYKLRVKAPAQFQPASQIAQDAVVDEWEALHTRLLTLAEAAAGLHLTRVKLTSPVSDRLRISLLGAYHIIAAHDRRHLWQASQVLAARD